MAGSVKLVVTRDIFSNNPSNYHPIISKTMSGRCFEKNLEVL